MADEAERQFARELVVPFGTDDVIVKDARTIGRAAEARQEISVVDGELTHRPERQGDLRVARLCEKRCNQRRAECGVIISVNSPTYFAVGRDTLGEAILEEKAVVMVREIAVVRQGAEVDRAKQFVPHVGEGAKKNLALKQNPIVGIGEPLQPVAFVVPIVNGENAGAMPNQMLAFRSEAVHRELAEAADVGTAEKSRLRLKSLRRVLIHHVVFHFAGAVLEPIVKGRSALVRTIIEVRRARQSLNLCVPGLCESDFRVDAANAI